MKRFYLFAFICAILTSCEDLNILERLDDHEQRISSLETFCNQSNTNISALQDIVQALQENEHVQTVVPIKENGEEIGYVVTLSSGKTLTIYHPANDSGNVPSGNAAPSIGVKKDSDGMYYWTFGGEWLTDNTGNRVKAVGTDGKDGKDGKNGCTAKARTPKACTEEGTACSQAGGKSPGQAGRGKARKKTPPPFLSQ